MSFTEAGKAIDELKTSKPIYKFTLNSTWSGESVLKGSLMQKVSNTINPDNHYSELAINFMQESLAPDRKSLQINRDDILYQIQELNRQDIISFLKWHSESKNIFDTKLGKWYSRFALKGGFPEYKETLFSIGKYIRINKITSSTPTDDVHVKNTRALLQLFYEKNFQEGHLNSRARKRRRK